ncbi:MAG: glycosyltransferase [Bacteroidetes bacterium]|nr:glycosyltransferase [Bacteroidota bacterium]
MVIIPTYNERENIVRMISAVLGQPRDLQLLVVDDGSPDGTAQLVREAMNQFPGKVHLLERSGKLGLGTAYIAGFRWALDRDYETVTEMDADFSHNPDDLIRLIDRVQAGADLAIGSRYVAGGGVTNWPTDRVLLSKYASIYVRLITWMPVRDTTAGFVCYHRRVLQTLDLSKIRFVGYAFQIEMKFAAWKLGFKLAEVPIIFVDRIAGASKMSKGIFKEAALGVWEMKFRSLTHSYRKN